ncbi:MAG: hypothetical protein DWQ04_33925 [Chloroflexi bacterium]|nr:MAG: hypothetical protein DWQ04_33925 [Chloroflexota bacterium]
MSPPNDDIPLLSELTESAREEAMYRYNIISTLRCSFIFTGVEKEAEAIKEIYRVTMGNLRRVMQFVEQVERVAQVNGQGIAQNETVNAVAALMANGRF